MPRINMVAMVKLSKPKKPRKKYNPFEPEVLSVLNMDYLEANQVEEYTPPARYRRIQSVGIEKLATPKRLRPKFVRADQNDNLFPISPMALKYKLSSKIKRLARPKYDRGIRPRDNPFDVSKKALSEQSKSKQKYYDQMATQPKWRWAWTKKRDNKIP